MAGKPAHSKDQGVKLGIALQGGGAYGAYAKGVLKALFNSRALNAPSMEIKAVTGTSAGAVNGALITYGLNSGGTQEAVRRLDSLWKEVGDNGRVSHFFSAMFPTTKSWPNLPEIFHSSASLLPKGYVPKQLKSLMEQHVPDWKHVQKGPVKLFVNAVEEDAETGKRRHIVFSGKDLTADAVAASGSLEDFGAHTFNGRKFYDGAYWRNPCMSDITKEGITDLLVITLQRVPENGIKPEHQDKARSRHSKPGHELLTEEIHNHIAYIHKQYPALNLHVISLKVDPAWDDTSRMNTDPKWLKMLEKIGLADGEEWLKNSAKDLGKKSSYILPSPKNTGARPQP